MTDPGSYLIDSDGDGILERMVKFERSRVIELVGRMIKNGEYIDENGKTMVELSVSWSFLDGTNFRGRDIVRIVDPVRSHSGP